MKGIEHELREALKRREPPTGFAERVIDTVVRSRRETWRPTFWKIAASFILAVIAAFWVQHYRQEKQARAVHEQLVVALEITSQQLLALRDKLMTRVITESHRESRSGFENRKD